MCGIAGILDINSKETSERFSDGLEQMLNALKHRGPDDRGEEKFIQRNGLSLYLGHQRLSIIDPGQGGHQPMSNDDSSLWISTNSEIYNYRELKNELQPMFNFRSNSDTEVLLKSYEAWGLNCLEKLRGMFAFAIWDSTNSQLILARDRLGIKPLYYYSKNNIFIFSSELRAILKAKIDQPSLSQTGIFKYLSYGRLGTPETILDSIVELPPGHFLIIDNNGIKIQKYWDPFKKSSPLYIDTPIVEQIGDCLEDVVRLHLISDVSLGAFLSGGIDSSAIVSMMASSSSNPIQTLSVTFNEKEYDESKYSTLIANKLGTKHYDLPLSGNELLNNLSAALESMDQPTVDGINTYMISQIARDKGLKVALSGLGGDELFAGYDFYSYLSRSSQYQRFLPKVIQRIILTPLLDSVSTALSKSDRPEFDLFSRQVEWISSIGDGPRHYLLLRNAWESNNAMLRRVYHQDFLASVNINLRERFEEYFRDADHSVGAMQAEFNTKMVNDLLHNEDTMSMAHSIECRVPWLDLDFVRFAATIPSKIRFQPGIKRFLKNSLYGVIPEETLQKKKWGFTLDPVYKFEKEIKPLARDVLLSTSFRQRNR